LYEKDKLNNWRREIIKYIVEKIILIFHLYDKTRIIWFFFSSHYPSVTSDDDSWKLVNPGQLAWDINESEGGTNKGVMATAI